MSTLVDPIEILFDSIDEPPMCHIWMNGPTVALCGLRSEEHIAGPVHYDGSAEHGSCTCGRKRCPVCVEQFKRESRG
jgi:hypothetical protein